MYFENLVQKFLVHHSSFQSPPVPENIKDFYYSKAKVLQEDECYYESFNMCEFSYFYITPYRCVDFIHFCIIMIFYRIFCWPYFEKIKCITPFTCIGSLCLQSTQNCVAQCIRRVLKDIYSRKISWKQVHIKLNTNDKQTNRHRIDFNKDLFCRMMHYLESVLQSLRETGDQETGNG